MKARILAPSSESIKEAARLLLQSEVVGMPTETVYGLAGVATDERALSRIFEAKERPVFDPLIVHVASPISGSPSLSEILPWIDSEALGRESETQVEALISRFWPGPLTLVLPKSARIPDLVSSGMPSVGLRMPNHPVAQALIREVGAPLAAPSANRFGRISPTRAEDVASELGDQISLILDGGPSAIGVESTVLRIENSGNVTLLRPGGIAPEAIEAALKKKLSQASSTFRPGTGVTLAAAAPGMSESHYAPEKRVILLPDAQASELRGKKIALLTLFSDEREVAKKLEKARGAKVVKAICLSRSHDFSEAARALFSSLRALDSSEAEVLVAEPCDSPRGLGYAIADRLRRAAARRP